MSDLRHIHDPVLSSLKMEGIRFFLCDSSGNYGKFGTETGNCFSCAIN
jgi:hypothetical protein